MRSCGIESDELRFTYEKGLKDLSMGFTWDMETMRILMSFHKVEKLNRTMQERLVPRVSERYGIERNSVLLIDSFH